MSNLYDSQADAIDRINKKIKEKKRKSKKTTIIPKIPKPTQKGLDKNIAKGLNKINKNITRKKPKKLSPNQKAYNKALRKLKRNIDKVVKEGYTVDTNIPRKPIRPTEKSIKKIEKLNKKVLDESTRYDKERGEMVTRRATINRERNRRSQIKRAEKALQQGKTLSDAKRKELLNERLSNGSATGEPLALNDIRVIKYIDRVEETFFRLEHTVNRKGEVNRSLIEWIMDWRSLFHDWVNSHNDAERMAAFEQVEWSKFMVRWYSSDGVGLYDFLVDFEHEMLRLTGMQPKIDISDVDLTDYEQYIAQDLGV